MEQKKSGGTHTVMPKKLAEALMEAGMQHFDSGGTPTVAGVQGPPISSQNWAPGTPVTGQANGEFQGIGFANTTNPNTWFNGSHNSQSTPQAGGVQPTQTFGQHTADNLGLGGFGRDAATQIDSLQGMNLYNAQMPGISQQNFAPQIAGTRQAQANTYMAQNNLAQQLLQQSRGQGPNIAQTQLANATGQNVQQQGAMMASQRGANANPALLARQAAMQGSNAQQQAAGQSAALQAQQQIAAQQQLQGLYSNQAQNAIQAEQVQQQAQAAQNSAINQGSLGAQTINANTSGQNAQRVGGMQTGFQNALGGMMAMLSDGGTVSPTLTPYQSFYVDPNEGKPGKSGGSSGGGGGGLMSMLGGGGGGMACGGKVSLSNYLAGGSIPGKAKVSGDSKKNDTVPALLSPGEVVLPRSVTESPNMEKEAIAFLQNLKGVQKKGYGGVISAREQRKK